MLLQVTEINGNTLSFDVIDETLRATNLGALQIGSPINFERSAKVGDEIGGHNVSGHVATTATVASIRETADNRTITFKVHSKRPEIFLHSMDPSGDFRLDVRILKGHDCLSDTTTTAFQLATKQSPSDTGKTFVLQKSFNLDASVQ